MKNVSVGYGLAVEVRWWTSYFSRSEDCVVLEKIIFKNFSWLLCGVLFGCSDDVFLHGTVIFAVRHQLTSLPPLSPPIMTSDVRTHTHSFLSLVISKYIALVMFLS